jgi:predicted transglutaminase-like cysteine proteinase
MAWCSREILVAGFCAALTAAAAFSAAPAGAQERLLYVAVQANARAPIGWLQFCTNNPRDCAGVRSEARDVVLSAKAWNDLVRVNKWVNGTIKPVTDLEHWGVVEKWSYPDDGYGDCEDYVLLKRRMLIERGWPESTLLITVVRDENNEGHAVLTARTDIGDLVLDNKRAEIVRWSDTPYTFIKQQSERNPLVWTSLMPPSNAQQTTVSASYNH